MTIPVNISARLAASELPSGYSVNREMRDYHQEFRIEVRGKIFVKPRGH